MKLRVGMNTINLTVSDEVMEKSGNAVTKEVLRELANDLSSKLITMDDVELRKFFTSFSFAKEESIDNPEVGMVVDMSEGPAVIVKVNKKTVNVVTTSGLPYACGIGGLVKSKVTLEEFKNMRTYNFDNKKDCGAFYKVKGEGGKWVSCLLICSGKNYKLRKINALHQFYTLSESDLDKGKSVILESNEVVK